MVLNLAGIDVRDPAVSVATRMRKDAPLLRVALGSLRVTETSTLYQQLHAYPVGSSSKALAEGTHGAKFHIAPVRRELVSDLDVVIGCQALDLDLPTRVRAGLRGEVADRYGLPFAGDNNFLIDRIDVLDAPLPAHWLVPVTPGGGMQRGSARMTIEIDRDDSSRSRSLVFAPTKESMPERPDSAWVWTPRAPD
jgi:CRISPR-associated protein Cas5t